MAINFPDAPSVNDVFVAGGSAWLWTGTTWIDAIGSSTELTMDSLVNVSAASAVTGEVVQYNGTSWVNADIIAQIVDAAPGTLDTLNELAAALGDDENFATTIANSLANRKLEITYSISADTTLVAGGRYIVDTSSALTLTLPAAPSLGDEVWIIDSTNTAATNNITVNNGGSLINGVSDTLVIDVSGAIASLVYSGATLGWRI
jgi:hypothetical protein